MTNGPVCGFFCSFCLTWPFSVFSIVPNDVIVKLENNCFGLFGLGFTVQNQLISYILYDFFFWISAPFQSQARHKCGIHKSKNQIMSLFAHALELHFGIFNKIRITTKRKEAVFFSSHWNIWRFFTKTLRCSIGKFFGTCTNCVL